MQSFSIDDAPAKIRTSVGETSSANRANGMSRVDIFLPRYSGFADHQSADEGLMKTSSRLQGSCADADWRNAAEESLNSARLLAHGVVSDPSGSAPTHIRRA